MVLIFGAGDQSQDLGEVAPLVCPNCHNEVSLHHVRTQRRFSLYFVPVATMSSDEYLVCPICSHGMGIPAGQVTAVRTMSAVTAGYRRGSFTASYYEAEVTRFWSRMGLPAGPATAPVGPPAAAPASAPGVAAGAGSPSEQAGGSDPSLADRLADLGRLHATGILTDEEFAAAKARILGA